MKIEVDQRLIKSLLVLASLIDSYHPCLAGHSWRVSQIAKVFGKILGCTEVDVFILSMGGFLHDLGKIGVPEEVLLKPSPLDHDEYEIIKTHPKIGYDLIAGYPFGELFQDIICHHHERHNGKGYPHSLAKGEISLFSRIIGVVDAFDAMTSPRPYRRALTLQQALSILEKEKDKQFDGELISCFLDISNQDHLMHIIRESSNRLVCADSPFLYSGSHVPFAKKRCEICRGWSDGKNTRVIRNLFSVSI
jgi:HD-GYP domain-containing protein (c-di-GMP phosphodiesterase class II)